MFSNSRIDTFKNLCFFGALERIRECEYCCHHFVSTAQRFWQSRLWALLEVFLNLVRHFLPALELETAMLWRSTVMDCHIC